MRRRLVRTKTITIEGVELVLSELTVPQVLEAEGARARGDTNADRETFERIMRENVALPDGTPALDVFDFGVSVASEIRAALFEFSKATHDAAADEKKE